MAGRGRGSPQMLPSKQHANNSSVEIVGIAKEWVKGVEEELPGASAIGAEFRGRFPGELLSRSGAQSFDSAEGI